MKYSILHHGFAKLQCSEVERSGEAASHSAVYEALLDGVELYYLMS